jgi:hypothetical protein
LIEGSRIRAGIGVARELLSASNVSSVDSWVLIRCYQQSPSDDHRDAHAARNWLPGLHVNSARDFVDPQEVDGQVRKSRACRQASRGR